MHPYNLSLPSLQDLQQRLIAGLTPQAVTDGLDTTAMLQDEPLIRFVNRMILDAAEQNASDIHVEPFQEVCRIRCRRHGVLQVTAELPVALAGRLTARLKIMASLDIAERRLPQDGRFHFQNMDIRINTCPVLQGEKCVLRLLSLNSSLPELTHTGMSVDEQRRFCRALSQPQGMVLVTGPTGSGKTVTLYAGLNHLNHPGKNIATVEDPVEIRFCGINQVSIHPRAGLHFTTVLRALLRQDPDVIMVGEIRDPETAQIAVQAAQTGHLVLSTLHANRASEALLRLSAMGVAPALVTASVRLIIAQRLLRVLCRQCRRPVCPDRVAFPKDLHTGIHTLYEATGCSECIGGYTGRTAIFEFLQISPDDSVETPCIGLTLRQAGVAKVLRGETSPSELIRVLET